MRMQNKRPRASARRGESTWPVAYRWLATGTIAIYTAIGCKIVTPAMAQELPGPTRPADRRKFAIAPGILTDVTGSFETVSGIHVTLTTEGIGNLSSPGVSGVFTPEAALDRLLEGTGVAWRASGSKEVVLSLKQVKASVDVAGTVSALSTSMPKYSEPIQDTPQTISVVSQNTMQEQNATTLRDALRNVAGISLAAGEGGSQGDNLTIRGFTARNDLYLDGMRDFGSYYRDPFDLQEVEVLQGPSSTTFGRGSTGGVVNQAAKAPSLTRFFSGTFDGGTDLTRRATADVNLPVPALGTGAAFRLNIMGDEGNVAGRDVAENRRFGVAPSLSLGLGTPTRWTFSYFHQDGDDIPDYGIPWLFNGPAPVDRQNYYGFSKGNFLRTYDDVGTVKFEHDFNEHVSIRNQVRDANYVRDAQITEPQLTGTVTLATPLDQILVTCNEISVNSVEKFLDDQLDLTVNFQNGPIHQTLTAGVEISREISDPTRPKYTNVPTTSLLNPDPVRLSPGWKPSRPSFTPPPTAPQVIFSIQFVLEKSGN
jgi:catecholate siderophore receptor